MSKKKSYAMKSIEQKETLPILMGIDSNFDVLIEQKLREK